MEKAELQELLDEKFNQFNCEEFIETDPIQIPKMFADNKNIEIAGFLTAIIAWGNRKMIIKNSMRMIELMDNNPLDFIVNHKEKDLKRFNGFVHRTFNEVDIKFFIESLKNIYLNHNGLEGIFIDNFKKNNEIRKTISAFRKVFFEIEYPKRTEKHLANVEKNSAAKRVNMFLRWMVRKDKHGVDFGIWDIPTSELMMPLDVHSGNVSRKLGLLLRTQNDWKAVDELTTKLKQFDKQDPVKYDFALFGMGVFEGF
jgi:uncharacterized protein (TIGR02757 family)